MILIFLFVLASCQKQQNSTEHSDLIIKVKNETKPGKDDLKHRVAYNQGLMPTRFPVVAKITAKEKNEKAIMDKDSTESRPKYINTGGIWSYASGNTPSIYTGDSYVFAYRPLPDSQTLTNNMYLGAITKLGGKTDRNTFGRYGNADSLKGKATIDRAGFGHSYGGRNSYWSGLPEENIGGQGLLKQLPLEEGGLSYENKNIRYGINDNMPYATSGFYNGFQRYSTHENAINQIGRPQVYNSFKQRQTFVNDGESRNINGRQQVYGSHISNGESWGNNDLNSRRNHWMSPYEQSYSKFSSTTGLNTNFPTLYGQSLEGYSSLGTSGDSQGYFYSGNQDYNQDNGYWLSHLAGKYSNTAYGSSPTTLNEDYRIKPSGKYLGPIDSNNYYGYKIISKSIPGYGNFQGFGITDHNGLRNGGGSSYSNKEIQNEYGTSDSYLTQGQGILQSQHRGDEFSSRYDRKVYVNSKVGTSESSLLDPEFHGNSGVHYGTRETYNAGLSPGKYGTHETFSHTPQGYQNEGYNQDEPSSSIYGRNHEIFSTNQNHQTKYGAQIVKDAYPEHGSIAYIGGELGADQQNIVHTSLNLEQD